MLVAAAGATIWTVLVRSESAAGALSARIGLLVLVGVCALLIAGRRLMLAWALRSVARGLNAGRAAGLAEHGAPAELLPVIRAFNALRDSLEDQQRAAREQGRRAELLVRLATGLRAAHDPPAIVATTLSGIATYTDSDRASIILVGPSGAIEHASAVVGGRLAPLPRSHAARALEQGLAGWVLRHGQATILADVAGEQRWTPIGDHAPRGSAIALPLSDGHTIFGVLTVTHTAPGRFAERDLPLFEGAAVCASLALNAAQCRTEEQSRRSQALSLFSMSQFATSERSLDDLAAELLDKSGELFDTTHTALFLPEVDGTLALAGARVWRHAGDTGHTEKLMATLAGAAARAWRDRATITELADAAPASSADSPANRVCVALPLLHNGETAGVFALVCQATGGAVLSARAWSMLTILTNVAAAALAHRQTIEQLHRRAERLEQEVRERSGQLLHSRDLLRVVFDHLPDGLVLLDASARVLAANDTFCREVLELEPRAVAGQHYLALANSLEQRGQLRFEPRADDTAAQRACRLDQAGQPRWYEVDRYPVGSDGLQVIERWRDVTRQEELRHRLLLHEQLASLGRLAASVVHEVGNPLQSVRSCLDLCRETCELPAPAAEYLELARGELTRMAHILAQLRDLSRPPRQSWERSDLNEVIRAIQRITAPQLRHDKIALETQLAPSLPPVSAQPGALHQVLLNLVLNAAAAMPEGGTIAIATQKDPIRRMSCATVADTGVGMTPQQLNQLFEPFATGTAQGVGLGLYLSQQIIQKHGGSIDITSTVNLGTTVAIYLPWSEANDDD